MKLLTKAIEAALEKAPHDQPPAKTKVVVKYFTPDAGASWFITEGERLEDDDWLLFGFADLGDPQMAELGSVLLSQLAEIRGGLGLPVERDMYYPDTTLADVLSEYGKGW